jgi:hypothetical protein
MVAGSGLRSSSASPMSLGCGGKTLAAQPRSRGASATSGPPGCWLQLAHQWDSSPRLPFHPALFLSCVLGSVYFEAPSVTKIQMWFLLSPFPARDPWRLPAQSPRPAGAWPLGSARLPFTISANRAPWGPWRAL